MTVAPAAVRPTNIGTVSTVMAIACGVTVANLYYGQPLLDLISKSFGVGQGAASLVVTLTQAGYVVGLLFLVPLGDLLENRRLVTRMLLVTAVALAVLAFSPYFTMFLILSVFVGTTSVAVQVLVPMAAHLAPPGQEGAVVGKVMGGLLLGILLARTAASAIAEVFGWRAIFLISAVLMLAMSALLVRMLPERRHTHDLTYRDIMASVADLVRHEPRLRRRAFCQAMMFGAFTAYWTAIAFELIDEHGFSQGKIAIFALVGAGGAAAAPIAGRIADRGFGEIASGAALLTGSLTMTLARFGHGSVLLLGVAAVLLDFAVQSHQVMSQHVIYTLRPDARARINTVFMVTVFVGGTIASALTGWLHSAYGWEGVCTLGIVLPLLGFVVWLSGTRSTPLRTPARAHS